ncbi:heparinase II/III family protein [Pontibacter sp. 13R65]|uniref:heparinase II/III domain-containing protein n=1 Tax=Pontibacter sp. 13R65 TaxID=3127458 RepID=UPI00301E047B
MIKRLFLFVFILVWLQGQAQEKKLLSSKFTKDELKAKLIPMASWEPFPRLQNRDGWANADQKAMEAYLKEAEKFLDYEWPSIPATKSLLIVRTGDRDEYQNISFSKRKVLGTLLLAEIYENKGRFIDPIINGVWSICEESFWGVPAHLPSTPEHAGLINVADPFVDLFAAETAVYLAWVDYFLGEKLDAVSPQIRKRIYHEVNKRMFEPVMTTKHFWMASGDDGRPPNNWNPWITSNWLNSALLLEKDELKRSDMVYKALQVLDEFLDPYYPDGGCDEGPGYWDHASAALYDNISLLNLASNNAFGYVYQNEKFKNMGKFIYRAQISSNQFLNFADAVPNPTMSAEMIYRYGKDIKDTDMMQFGAYYHEPVDGQLERFHYFRNFFSLFMQEEFRQAKKRLPLPKDVWLPDLQVMMARDNGGSTKGFYVAAKGGHNDESHNHNDIGNYVVYYNGQPLLIDAGRGTYTSKTFSKTGRYEIWSNCSDYHNTPTINGLTQLPGREYKATQVLYNQGKTFAAFTLNMAGAYPAEAGINSWHRTVKLNRGKNVQVTDVIDLGQAKELTQHLMTCYPAEVRKPGELLIHYKTKEGQAQNFIVKYNPDQMQPIIEKLKLEAKEDQGIIQNWGDSIYRISFKVMRPQKIDRMLFEIVAEKAAGGNKQSNLSGL